MNVSQYTDIGLRLLMYLGADQRLGHVVTLAEVCQCFNIPRNHLVKVAGNMTKLGWITAIRGRKGGVTLNAKTLAMPLGDMVRALEGDQELVNCGQLSCCLMRQCVLRTALRKAQMDFYLSLNQYTLAQLVQGSVRDTFRVMQKDFLDDLNDDRVKN